MQSLAAADWLILLIYCFFTLTAGFSLRPFMNGSRDFLQAGRTLPAWLCGMAMAAAGLGAPELLGMSAAGAHFGLAGLGFFALGSIPAMLFAGLYMTPALYGSKSRAAIAPRSIPEYLGQRFDHKTRILSASLFIAMSLFVAGISLYAMARVLTAIDIFGQLSSKFNLTGSGILILAIVFPALLVVAYILLGGLSATIYTQALQFCVVVAGLVPMAFLGLKRIGGWSGLKSAVPQGLLHEWGAGIHSGPHSMGIGAMGLILGVGLVLGGGTWCTDFRLLQSAMAAKNAESARRTPLIAAALWVLVPLLLVVPGLVAIGMPTPHTTIFVRNENGAIYHDITVVSPAAEAGKGLVPAKADTKTGQPIKAQDGQPVLDYAMADPKVLVNFLPIGLLGLGIAALLACLMSGVAASLMASSTVFTCDLYQAIFDKNASDKRILLTARLAAAGGILLAAGVAFATMKFNSVLDAMLLGFALVNAPLFAVLLLGALWKRTTGHGAFAGLVAGIVAALLCHGLMLPLGEPRGIHGGWIAVVNHPANDLTFGLGAAIVAFFASLIATSVVSLSTTPRAGEEIRGLVYSLADHPPVNATWWKRPEAMAALILLAAIAVNLIFI